MRLRGRYAPSPTGPLHLGNARTALLAWLQVRVSGGSLVVRMEDLDLPRTKKGSAEQILDDLHWLGLDWDEGPDVGGPGGPYLQSQRTQGYQDAFSKIEGCRKGLPLLLFQKRHCHRRKCASWCSWHLSRNLQKPQTGSEACGKGIQKTGLAV